MFNKIRRVNRIKKIRADRLLEENNEKATKIINIIKENFDYDRLSKSKKDDEKIYKYSFDKKVELRDWGITVDDWDYVIIKKYKHYNGESFADVFEFRINEYPINPSFKVVERFYNYLKAQHEYKKTIRINKFIETQI